jgi:two-component system, NarL family, invasion response regulator UvrY
MECKRLIMADRHLGVLEGSHDLLRELFRSIVMVADEQSLLESVAELRPDLVIIDLSLSRVQEPDIASKLLASHPDLRVIVMSIHEDTSIADKFMAAGMSGYVFKRAVGTELIRAVRAVLAGSLYVSPGLHSATIKPPDP